MAIWSRLTSGIAGLGVGAATADAITPEFEPLKQTAWRNYPSKVLDPNSAARAYAENVETAVDLPDDAARTGVGTARFDLLTELARTAPGVPELLTLLRRKDITPAELEKGFYKARLPLEWHAPLRELANERLDPAVLANAIVRGIMTAPFDLPKPPPETVGKVKAFPTSTIKTLDESEASGVDKDRLFVMTAIAGRPMSPESAAAAAFRGIIDRVDYDRAISEGDVRNEWSDAIFEHARQIPSAIDGIQGRLRGWLKDPEMYAQTARHGMSKADTDLMFKIHGRPPSWHQVWIGLQRGGTYDGPIDIIDPAFRKALEESDLRPEWYNLLWHSRYNYPSPFVLRQLTTSGAISVADAEQVLKFEGYEPTFAAKIATAWAGGATGAVKTDPNVKKAETSLFSALHKSYVAEESDAAAVTPGLTALAIPPAARTEVLALWSAERALIRAQLTPAQIKKAVRGAVINPATGVAWTQADALAAMLARGYDQADAETFLAE